MKNQLETMHRLYGKDHAHKCGQCSNFVRGRYHDRMLQKCERFGLSHSETSDWAQRWPACGMFNVPMPDDDKPVKDWAKRAQHRIVADEPADGQIRMEDMLCGP